MINQIIYELFRASEQAQPEKMLLDLDEINQRFNSNDYIKNYHTKSQLRLIHDSHNISENEVLEAVIDRIVLMNGGIPSKQKLGAQYFKGFKYLFATETLYNLGYAQAALFTALKAVKLGKKYFFPHIVFQASRIIYEVERRNNNSTNEARALKTHQEYLRHYTIEREIEIERNLVLTYYNSPNSNSSEVKRRCDAAITKFSQYEKRIPSFIFHNHYYFFRHLKFTNEKNHLAVYDNAQQAIDYFNSLSFRYGPGIMIFTYILIVHSIQKKLFLKGENYIINALKSLNKGSMQWYRIIENYILLNLHRGSYEKAIQQFYNAFHSEYYVKVTPFDKRRWRLYQAYIRLLLESKVVPKDTIKKRYSIQKFVNELPAFSKDKRAHNIPLLIAQLLFLIVRRKYDQSTDRITALEKYSTRYLRNDDTFRSNCFIKMLLEIPKQGFNRTAVERHAEKYYKRLTTSEIELIDQPFEIEIIPYEKLWEIILDNLSKKKRYKTAI